MRRIEFTIGPDHAGRTVEQYLKGEQGMSTRVLSRLKKTPEGLLLNGVHTRTIDLLGEGDVLSITIEDDPQEYHFCTTPVEILYEDDDVLVYNKPFGMPCHQARDHQHNTLANVFAYHCAQRGEKLAFRVINRMDMDTTGAVVVAKNAHAATRLGGEVDKTYEALVCGFLPWERGVIDAPIGRDPDSIITRRVAPTGQASRTGFQVTGRSDCYTLARFRLYTGRTHQIRVHMSWLGYPLAGDDLYGSDRSLIGRQALHCVQVRFRHPVTGEFIQVDAPLLPDMQRAISLAGILLQ